MRKRQRKKKVARSSRNSGKNDKPPDVIAGGSKPSFETLGNLEKNLEEMRMICLTKNFNPNRAEMLAYQIRKLRLEREAAEWAANQSQSKILKRKEGLLKEIHLLEKAGKELFIQKIIGEKYAQIKGLNRFLW